MLMLAGNMKYPGVNIRLAWPVLVSLLQLHNPAVVQLDVMLTERLCSNNARPSGSSGTLLTSFTLHLRRTVSRPLPTLLYDTPLLLQISTGQPTSCLTVHPSSFRLCRTAYFLFYRTPFSLQTLQDGILPVLPYTLQPSESHIYDHAACRANSKHLFTTSILRRTRLGECFTTSLFFVFFHGALRPQKPYGLLGTGKE